MFALLAPLVVAIAGFAPSASDVEVLPLDDYVDSKEIPVVDPGFGHEGSAVVVDEDGLIVEVVDQDTGVESRAPSLAAASACSYRNALFINYTGWQVTVDGCSIIGFDRTARWNYQWYLDTQPDNAGPACMQGRGYFTDTTVPRWYGAGCNAGGGVSAYIGNVATVAKMRGYSVTPPFWGYVRWR